jgi:hypothetical protein
LRSSRQGCEPWGVEVPLPSIARFGRLAYLDHGEVTNCGVPRRRSHGRPVAPTGRCGGSHRGGEQTGGPERKGMAAAPKRSPGLKWLSRIVERRPATRSGKAVALREETSKCTSGATGVWVQARREGFAERTSGRSISQQGLTTTCKDLPFEGRPEVAGGIWTGA